jgi:hypothetical protein
MPLALNLKDIKTFDDLPYGEYYGELAEIKFIAAKQQGKRSRLQAKYLVLDGEQTGRFQSEFLTMDTGFLVKWLQAFGLDQNTEGLAINDEDPNDTEVLLLDDEPILIGSKVIFSVSPDKKDAQYTRTTLVSVEENTLEAPAAPPARATVAPRRAAAAAVAEDPAEDEEAEDEAPAAPTRAAVAPRRAAAAAPRRTLR